MSETPHSRRARPGARDTSILLAAAALLVGGALVLGPALPAGARPGAPAPAEGAARRDQGPATAGGWLSEAVPVAATTGAAVGLVDAAADLAVALTPPPPPPSPGQIAVFAAMSVLGTPYRYGGTGPGGFDCSGLTGWAWAKAGVSLPRVSGAQMSAGTRVSVFDLRPGDLVFYGSGHVGMYAGDGRVVHAPRTGRTVEVVPLERGGMRPTSFVRPV